MALSIRLIALGREVPYGQCYQTDTNSITVSNLETLCGIDSIVERWWVFLSHTGRESLKSAYRRKPQAFERESLFIEHNMLSIYCLTSQTQLSIYFWCTRKPEIRTTLPVRKETFQKLSAAADLLTVSHSVMTGQREKNLLEPLLIERWSGVLKRRTLSLSLSLSLSIRSLLDGEYLKSVRWKSRIFSFSLSFQKEGNAQYSATKDGIFLIGLTSCCQLWISLSEESGALLFK